MVAFEYCMFTDITDMILNTPQFTLIMCGLPNFQPISLPRGVEVVIQMTLKSARFDLVAHPCGSIVWVWGERFADHRASAGSSSSRRTAPLF